jgi:hypothetical protein
MSQEETKFSTRDISLASTLVTLNFPLLSVDYQIEGERGVPVGYFNFEESPELIEAEKRYWQGKLAVDPKSFVTNWKGLKAQVTNVYKNPHSGFSK